MIKKKKKNTTEVDRNFSSLIIMPLFYFWFSWFVFFTVFFGKIKISVYFCGLKIGFFSEITINLRI
jgi:hypothetical protein